ncbi:MULTISPECIES: TetR/AcrR family transcriptional regulator [Rhizobium]|uniref:TetR family transcriptional regulator n=1 Tax=Rhizobium dioscoreae TaxID=2653122 RepID=A0ABQ0Z2U0_9HYPH|nr:MULTISPECIES: TetR/AcrR family transcriptional regulator [Rhizobium]MCZ3379545.1 TetR/AcrR family transcriptional regulator [Rhizobium sp. AG207R]GES49841.1 TetR family transcriptional regulator [Rhizobium dioscoreae]GLU84085.1 TetR family transcriptional regulator [Rhizobium sp. NBRC 114257]
MTIVKNIEEKENSSPRKRGRPPAFDRETVLAAARDTFWKHGYDGSSIADLTAAMGITPQSLYAAFGSKAELYRETLDQYRRMPRPEPGNPFQDKVNTVTAFERFLTNSAKIFTAPEHPKGCMISTAVLNCAEENEPIAHHVASMRLQTLDIFTARIERGIAEGDMRPDADARSLARFLGAIVQGMSVQARDGATTDELLALLSHALNELKTYQVRQEA